MSLEVRTMFPTDVLVDVFPLIAVQTILIFSSYSRLESCMMVFCVVSEKAVFEVIWQSTVHGLGQV